MNGIMLAIIILLPMAGALPVFLIKWNIRRSMWIYVEAVVSLTALLTFLTLFNAPADSFTLFSFSDTLHISFHVDGLSKVFAGLISFLWPLATLYAFEYMRKEDHQRTFFTFYILTYSVTLGIALSANMFTMYCFYEMLTMVTLPLVLHSLSRESILAGRSYLYYSMGGAAFAFIGMIVILSYGSTTDFVPGGVFAPSVWDMHAKMLQGVYVMSFLGFSVKAAMFPFGQWLPKAGVAPTPVTALLHAVAVVKAGAFAIIRLTYYSYGTENLKGSFGQYIPMTLVIFTIVYGCSRALKETHFKRRLAYSTMSNLSYILFGVTLMTPLGLTGALCHLVFHALIKISSFFCAGAVIHQTGKEYIGELDGLGKRMPITFTIFTVSGLALMGVPMLPGFVSKWMLAGAAVEDGGAFAFAGIAALLISAILTAVYMLTVSVRAFIPGRDIDMASLDEYRDPNLFMLIPLIIFTAVIFILGVHPGPLTGFLGRVAGL